MKVLHILNELKRSGAETMLRNASSELISADDKHYILSTGTHFGDYAPELERAGFFIEHIPFERSFSFIYQIYSLIKSKHIDIVHVHAERGNLIYALASRISGVACVRTVHNTFLFTGGLRLRRILTRAISRSLGVRQIGCASIVAENENTRFLNKIDYIENWINSQAFPATEPSMRQESRKLLSIPDDMVVILTVGSCIETKNHKFLIQMMKHLPDHYILVHCGTGELEMIEQNICELLDIAHRVHFAGSVADVQTHLFAADVFVMSSFFEGGSIALLEALATGLPCVTTRVGMASQLEQLPNLVIAPLEEATYAAQLVALISRPDELAKTSAIDTSNFVHENYSPQRGAREYKAVYGKLSGLELDR